MVNCFNVKCLRACGGLALRLLVVMPVFVWLTGCAVQQALDERIVWHIEDLFASAANADIRIEGDPIKSTRGGVFFDGDGDRIVVRNNPLANSEAFTIEMKIFPRAAYPDNVEPRVLHIESEEYPNRRITLELRLNEAKQWYLDGFIKSDSDKLTLIDPQRAHPVEQWYYIALTYKNGVFKTWVNGQQELSGRVNFQALSDNARVSIGARLNRIHWFQGDIETVYFSRGGLDTGQLKIEH